MLAMKATKGAVWLVFSRFFGRAVDLLTLLVLARVLTPADFGVTALALSLVVVVDTILEVPVVQAMLRFKEIKPSHIDTGFTLGVLRGCAIGLFILAVARPFALFYGDPRLMPVILCIAIGPIARSLASPRMAIFAKELSFQQMFITEFAGKICAFIGAVTVVYLNGGYWAIVVNSVGSAVASTIASYILAPYRPRLSLSQFHLFSSFIGWFSAAQIISALNWQLDRFLLGRFIDKSLLGNYSVANDLAVLPTQSVIGPAMQPVMAAFSRIGADEARMQGAFLKAARFVMLISMPACIGISVTADLSVGVLLGSQWQDAMWFLRWLALAVLPIPYFQTVYSLCIAIDRPNVIFKINLIDVVVRAILIIGGFSLFALGGVVAARILISLIMFNAYIYYAHVITGVGIFPQLRNIWKEALASVLMGLAVMGLRHFLSAYGLMITLELIISVAAGGLVYAGALLALGVRLVLGGGRFAITDRS